MVTNVGRLISLLASFALAGSALAQTKNSALTHCQLAERVEFSCRVGAAKIVSLCGGGTDGPLTSLAYRYGLIGKIENEFVARPDNARRFHGTVGPLNPRASLAQIWFERGGVTYLLPTCTGGSCPQHAGLAVISRYTHILKNVPCRFKGDDFDYFPPELVSFGRSVEDFRSATEMLIIEEVGGYEISQLFPNKGGPMW